MTPEYEFKFRFRTDSDIRAEFKETDVNRVITPFLFPRPKFGTTFIGCTVVRVDHKTDSTTETPI